MKEKKILYLISGITVCILVIGVSFAFWYLNLEQTTPNVVTSGCFSMEFTEGNAINLNDAYPISDEEGMKLTPYTFTIQNTCTTDSSYQINLETLTGSGKVLPDKYLKANLQEGNESKITTKLDKTINSELETETTIEGATTAYKLLTGTLTPNESKSYSLHLWMHSDVGPSSDSMNATYQGKINIVTSYTRTLATLEDTIKSLPIVTSGNGLYEVSHSDAEITYTDDVTAQNLLKQTELRYAGSNPNNYVEFNGELWRVIGLVNTSEGQRVKLIRNESIGSYSWDSSDVSINGGFGVNEWSISKLQNLLNEGAYFNRTNGNCYSAENNQTIACDFSNTGLLANSKEMIDEITWNLGSTGELATSEWSTENFYNVERSNQTGKICTEGEYCTDSINRTFTWQGQVGLMYPSDYGYATSGGDSTTRNNCLQNSLYNSWNTTEYSDCKNNDWLLPPNYTLWTLVSRSSTDSGYLILYISKDGIIYNSGAYYSYQVKPTIYLKSSTKVMGGNGSSENPYQLTI